VVTHTPAGPSATDADALRSTVELPAERVRAPEDQVEIMQLVAQYGPAVDSGSRDPHADRINVPLDGTPEHRELLAPTPDHAKGTVMPDLAQQLWDIEQIKQLKARYFRLMDTKDWDAWKDLFTPDCVHYLPKDSNEQDETSRPHLTNDEYLTQIPAMLDKAFTVHHGHMPEITILGPTEAEGITAMFDYVMWPDGKTAIKGYGHYHETYRKCEDGKWRISSKDNRRLRVDPIPNTL